MESFFARSLDLLVDQGPVFLLAVIMLYGLYRLIKGIGLKMVAALEKPAEALNRQAQSMERLSDCIQSSVNRDQLEHKEIIILQKVILEEVKKVRENQT